MGLDLPKQYLQLADLPILAHTVRALQRSSFIKTIILVVPVDHLEETRELVRAYDLHLVAKIVSGGRTRQESVRVGLQNVPGDVDLVVIHDGVRPLVDPGLVDACVVRAAETGAAMLAIPVKDTLKAVVGEVVGATVDRRGLWQAQTPQVARLALLKQAFAAAAENGFEGTDEASLLEQIGVKVSVVMGSASNIKVTRVDDLALAEALLGRDRREVVSVGMFRVGHGYDAHRLVADRQLVLGGVVIPYELGLLGHSDADVLLHALADAMLGAAGLGDIGRHFPDHDPAYQGISSLSLLGQVVELVRGQGFRLVNADVTVIAQQPKLAPYFPEMLENISRTLGVDPSCLNLKATTTEHMGFAGRGEGMAAHAVVSLAKSGD
jgi:2-C-methyl-D-erythritol 4-phosphate cytidylyltransferase/2-C-methyl-D-erythritol 2,4-cyclodiphosphate synthase